MDVEPRRCRSVKLDVRPSWRLGTLARLAAVAALCAGHCLACTVDELHRARLHDTHRGTLPTSYSNADASAELELSEAIAQVRVGRFEFAEPTLLRLARDRAAAEQKSQIALAEIRLMTGRYEQAARVQTSCVTRGPFSVDACIIAAGALQQQCETERAIALLQSASDLPGARHLRLMLADMLSEHGRKTEARELYRTLIEDYTFGRTPSDDTLQYAITGRAAHRLGMFTEAREFFEQLERAEPLELLELLWRGELALDLNDESSAVGWADAAQRLAPNHPLAALFSARIRLAAGVELEQAEQLALHTLRINPSSASAYAVLAEVALGSLDYARADRYIADGLARQPCNLDLLRVRAVARFLEGDTPGFDVAAREMLQASPNDTELFRQIAKHAEREQRYESSIPILTGALEREPDAAVLRAHLGIELLRSGRELEGRRQLERAFAQNPYDLRARNTLALYDRKLDKEYTVVQIGHFRIRHPIDYTGALRAIVPAWLERARTDLGQRYGNRLPEPLLVELYADQDSFGVRTSGAPTTLLEGVCFGRSIVARLPTGEPTNLGMTLWHELSHAYHYQLSHYRVPRWFTEGLAQVETARQRSEWSQHRDLALYQALRDGQLPHLSQMNEAFSKADSTDELTVVYLASRDLVDYLERRFGFEQLRGMLLAWNRNPSTEQVIREVLSTDIDEIDSSYRAELRHRLAFFDRQYVPRLLLDPAEAAQRTAAEPATEDARSAILIQTAITQGQLPRAHRLMAEVDIQHTADPDLLWAASILRLTEQNAQASERLLYRMLDNDHDGYFVRLQLALVARIHANAADERLQLQKAHDFYPEGKEPLQRLAAIAAAAGDATAELEAMESLAALEHADARVHQRVVQLDLDLGRVRAARLAAERLSFVDPLGIDSHRLMLRAASAAHDSALVERESRVLRSLLRTRTNGR